MKYCEDCKYFEPAAEFCDALDAKKFAHCKHESSTAKPDPLDEARALVARELKVMPESMFCSVARDSPFKVRCGPKARFFEPADCPTCQATGWLDSVCPACRGYGVLPVGPWGEEPECRTCHGSGEIREPCPKCSALGPDIQADMDED